MVVAIIDSGIRPYHTAFSVRAADTFFKMLVGQNSMRADHVLVLAGANGGTPSAAHDFDKQVWDSLRVNELYAFAGTNVLGLALPRHPTGPVDDVTGAAKPILWDNLGHGTRVASVVAIQCSNCVVLMIQYSTTDQDFVREGTGAQSDLPEAIRLAASLPWVDVISSSLGHPSELPATTPGYDASMRAAIAFAVSQGKTVIQATADVPAPTSISGTGGPPEVISIGGVEPSEGGSPSAGTGSTPDFVTNYSPSTADDTTLDVVKNQSATSYATPFFAAIAGEILFKLREDCRKDNASSRCEALAEKKAPLLLRDVLNRTARYWTNSDYAPRTPDAGGITSLEYTPIAPILPTPWVQMGWGYVGPEIVPAAVAYLKGESTPPPKPAEAVQYMETTYALREAYWSQRAG
ncbi:MAG: S8/S53 family peptidase [Euryarchaeota archaeon]|nr:S8/S53 family peptidase [Euryarchaeota archaeon]